MLKIELQYLKADWRANKGNTKGRFITACFRILRFFSVGRVARLIYLPLRIIYKVTIEWLLGVELPLRGEVGPGLRIFHGQSLVCHENVRIGRNVTLRHCTTIGNNGVDFQVPSIGDNVDIGANSIIIGPISIGDDTRIGAGSIVVKNIDAGSSVRSMPATAYTTKK